jgi:hypothetical protein
LKSGSFCHLLRVNFFLGLFFDPEDGRDMTTPPYISEDRNLRLLFIVQENWGGIGGDNMHLFSWAI